MEQLEFKVKQAAKQAERQIQSLLRQIDNLKEQKKGFIKLLASGTITEADYKEVTQGNNEEIASLQSKLMSLTANNSNGGGAESMLRLKKELKKFMGLKELTPDMLHRLVDKIVVKADGSANIQYKFAATAII